MSKTQLNDHLLAQEVRCITVQVESLEVLENIDNRFKCATIDEGYELVLDCARLEAKTEQQALREILKIPEDTYLPNDGYIVFWR